MYHQLMMFISAADVVSSIAWFMSTWPIPPEGIDAAIWGANGNFATCKLQGVMVIWSTASHWLNVSLSLYYKLVIVNGWRERQFTRLIRALLLGLPVLAGSTVAALSYRYIVPTGMGCSFLPFPQESTVVPFYSLIVIPLISSMAVVITFTFWICWKFSQQMQVADRWRLSGRRRDALGNKRGSVGTVRSTLSSWAVGVTQQSLEGSVLRQSIFYLLAFLSSVPVVLISFILLTNFIVNYWVSLLSLIVTPLQGFTNAIVFFRPRIFQWCSATKKKIRAAQLKPSSETSSDGHEDPTETNRTAMEREQEDTAIGVGRSMSTSVNRAAVDSDSTSELADDRRQHVEFLRSHLHGLSASGEDEMSMDFAELEREPELPEHQDSILVGSLVLPSFRCSSRWSVGNWEPEVSDYVCEQEDVIYNVNE